MKLCLLLVLFTTACFSFGQDSLDCNYLPVARPDQSAVVSGDLAKALGKASPGLKKGTHSAVFKLSVDCKGDVLKVYYQSGTLPETDQKHFADKLTKTNWKPAVDDGANVTSFVFVTINILNGKISTVVQ